MNKHGLIDLFVKTCSRDRLSKRLAENLLDSAFENIQKAIKKNKRFGYPGFGTFTLKNRKGWLGRNPQTGAEIQIKPTKFIGFKAAPKLKNSL